MATKSHATQEVSDIKNGVKDPSGNLITNVLAKGNEYAIYEIDTNDINNKLKVFIDGKDDDSEYKLAQAFIHVKEKYIIAKGLLYRSTNYGLMKNRVAHTLATALSGNQEKALEQFENLIVDINKEYNDAFTRRLFYIAPGYILLTLFVITLWLQESYYFPLDEHVTFWLRIAAASIIGGVFSLTLDIPKIRFEAEVGTAIFSVFGIERISISILAGIICTVGIKSKFIMANIFGASSDPWTLTLVVIASAFSEKKVPNMIMNIDLASSSSSKRPERT